MSENGDDGGGQRCDYRLSSTRRAGQNTDPGQVRGEPSEISISTFTFSAPNCPPTFTGIASLVQNGGIFNTIPIIWPNGQTSDTIICPTPTPTRAALIKTALPPPTHAMTSIYYTWCAPPRNPCRNSGQPRLSQNGSTPFARVPFPGVELRAFMSRYLST
jgi:hypothetical protein